MFRLNSLTLSLAATVVSVSAGTFVSPAAGSTISADGIFNFTWTSTRFFKESSQSISVLLGADFASSHEGIILAKDLVPVAHGVGESGPTYSASLTPDFVASSPTTGEFQLVVVEDFTAFGGSPGISFEYETITLA